MYIAVTLVIDINLARNVQSLIKQCILNYFINDASWKNRKNIKKIKNIAYFLSCIIILSTL